MEDHFDVAILGTGLPEATIAAYVLSICPIRFGDLLADDPLAQTSALAKKGFSVLQLDEEPFYGGSWASLSLEEALGWAHARRRGEHAASTSTSAYLDRQRRTFSNVSYSLPGVDDDAPRDGPPTLPPTLKKRSRSYALSLTPTLIPANSIFVDTLVSSGVSNYVNFRLLEGIGVYDEGEGKGKGKGRIRKVPASKEDVFKDPTLSLIEKRRLMKFLMWAGSAEWDTEDSRSSPSLSLSLPNPTAR